MLKWEKKGKIFDPKLINETNTHSQVPFGIQCDDVLRVYFTSRPPKNEDGTYVSHIYYVDFDGNNLSKIVDLKTEPILSLGEIGTFDEFGSMPCSVINHNNEIWMYYVGWTRMESVPYNCANGLAISKDNGRSFTKYSQGPIMGQSPENPFIVGCPRVFKFKSKLYMWYLGGTGWIKDTNKVEPKYNIKLSISEDGIGWNTIDHNLISSKYSNECQTSVTVFEHNNTYHMYFTYRHTLDFRNPNRGYRIGYAFSSDLFHWTRDDEEGGIFLSNSGWDSEMICYPFVTKINNKLIMLYCGNSFGKEGFGYAVLTE